MNNEDTFVRFICSPYIDKVIKSPFLGRPYIRFIDSLILHSRIFTIGALLGRAKPGKLDTLVMLFIKPETTSDQSKGALKLWRNETNQTLDNFKKEWGREPATIEELIVYPPAKRILENSSVDMSPQDAFKAYVSGDKKVRKCFDTRVDVNAVTKVLETMPIKGLCFGACFPGLTERMYNEAKNYEDLTDALCYELKGASPSTKGEFHSKNMTSIEEASRSILTMTTQYASKYHSELVVALEYRDDIPEADILEEMCNMSFQRALKASPEQLTPIEKYIMQTKGNPLELLSPSKPFPIRDDADPKEINRYLNDPKLKSPMDELTLLRTFTNPFLIPKNIPIPTNTMESMLRKLLGKDSFETYWLVSKNKIKQTSQK